MKGQPACITNSEGDTKPVLEYLPDYTVYLDLPCVLTLSKTLRIGMPYMYHEGLKTFPIRLLHIWDSDGFVFLRIQNIQTGQVYEISRNLNSSSEFCLWEIASMDYLMKLSNERDSSI
jgi:hypothetical protein